MSNTQQMPKDYQRIDSLIVYLSKLIYAQWSEVTANWGLTPPQNKILRILEQKNKQPINELSRSLGCTKSNLTGVIDSMVKSGLIQRLRNRKDRRIIRISLTNKSRELLNSIPPWSEIYCSSVTSELSEREAKILKKILEKLCFLYEQSSKNKEE